jgi:hypothetical protein
MLYEIIVIMLPVVAPISTCSTINEIGIWTQFFIT